MSKTKNKIITVGITGNISSGKSTVLRMFREHGCEIISTDEITHKLLCEKKTKKTVIEVFGKKITATNGDIDRKKLSKIVFQNPDKLKKLQLILHPQIEKNLKTQISFLPPNSIVAIEIPLLFEVGWNVKVNHTVLISCPSKIRRERFLKSGKGNLNDFETRDLTQWPEEKKSPQAEYIIDNSKDIDHVTTQVERIIKEIKPHFYISS